MKKIAAIMAVAAALFLSGCGGGVPVKHVKQYGGEKTKPDKVSERRITLLNPLDGEKISVTYYQKGKYDRRALSSINRVFRDKRTGKIGDVDCELIDYMVDIRSRLFLPDSVVFEILSGYRTAESNAALANHNGKVAQESLHIKGWAVDFRIKGVNGAAIAEIARTMQRGGVSYYPETNHVHVDIGNIRSWGAIDLVK